MNAPAPTTLLRVLVVEDHEDSRELFVVMLEMAGYLVHGAASVAQAKDILAVLAVDILVTAHELGDGSGAEVLAFCAKVPSVSILMPEYRTAMVDRTGFDVVLTKPVDSQRLYDAIRERTRVVPPLAH